LAEPTPEPAARTRPAISTPATLPAMATGSGSGSPGRHQPR
jgi:hypothetical protein